MVVSFKDFHQLGGNGVGGLDCGQAVNQARDIFREGQLNPYPITQLAGETIPPDRVVLMLGSVMWVRVRFCFEAPQGLR